VKPVNYELSLIKLKTETDFCPHVDFLYETGIFEEVFLLAGKTT